MSMSGLFFKLKNMKMKTLIIGVVILIVLAWIWMYVEFRNAPTLDENGNIKQDSTYQNIDKDRESFQDNVAKIPNEDDNN
jgi:uncharacterized protein YxeA